MEFRKLNEGLDIDWNDTFSSMKGDNPSGLHSNSVPNSQQSSAPRSVDDPVVHASAPQPTTHQHNYYGDVYNVTGNIEHPSASNNHLPSQEEMRLAQRNRQQ